MVASLLVTHGYHFGTRFDLLELTTIGRASACTIQLLDEKVSRLHSTVYREGDRFHVRDEGSSNGTGRNGQLLLESARLEPGDELAVGNNLMIFESRMQILRDRSGTGAVIIAEGGDPERISGGGVNAVSSGDRVAFQPASLQAAVARVLSTSRSSGYAWLVLEALVRGVGAERAALVRVRGAGTPQVQALLTYPGQSRVTIPRVLLDRVVEFGKGLRMEDACSQLKIRGGRTRVESRLGSSVCVPIKRRGELVALLYVDTQMRGAFRSLPLGVLEDVAVSSLSAVLEGVRVPPVRRRADSAPAPISISSEMQRTMSQIEVCAAGDEPFLIAGEEGSGREDLARHVHEQSVRRDGPFLSLACDALSEERAESVLFGHEKGAFAGAATRHRGKLEQADCGTLLLKEVGDIPRSLQLKLLRALQEGRFFRQGGSRPVYSDVRIGVATHRDFSRMIRDDEFREDLYLRLNHLHVDVPPLRRRGEDLEPMIARVVAGMNADYGMSVRGFEPPAIELLQRHRWRRNSRELEHVLRRVLLLCETEDVQVADVRDVLATQVDPSGVDETLELGQSIRQVESRVLCGAVRKAGGCKARAAALLGLSRESLDRRIAEYGVDLARELDQAEF